jgi:hypothetical protein
MNPGLMASFMPLPTRGDNGHPSRPAARPASRLWLVVGWAVLGAIGPSHAGPGHAHEHGKVVLELALDGPQLTIELEAPLDSLLGFERAPRTDAERKAAAQVLARLRQPGGAVPLLAPDPAAQCQWVSATVQAPALETPAAGASGGDGHADVVASYQFTCAQPGALQNLDVGLFDAFRRIQRLDAQVAGPRGQHKISLKRPARSLKLWR